MQVIIEIPESEIPKQQDIIEIPLHFIYGTVCEAGGYGFCVLPKGHGRLKDFDWIDDNCPDYRTEDGAWCYKWKDIDNAPTIIEAESEG